VACPLSAAQSLTMPSQPDRSAGPAAGLEEAFRHGRMPSSAVLLAALAALEHEFRMILSKTAPPTD
jgi:hypothetical protein